MYINRKSVFIGCTVALTLTGVVGGLLAINQIRTVALNVFHQGMTRFFALPRPAQIASYVGAGITFLGILGATVWGIARGCRMPETVSLDRLSDLTKVLKNDSLTQDDVTKEVEDFEKQTGQTGSTASFISPTVPPPAPSSPLLNPFAHNSLWHEEEDDI